MFTGIVEETGRVESITKTSQAIQLVVRSHACSRLTKIGDSLAINGCCLTVTKIAGRSDARRLQFDLLAETWRRTNLQFLRPGAAVNLERSLRAGGKISGHFVTGHIDGLGKITRWERSGRDHVLEIAAAPGLTRYIVPKGSIAVDGISLTVAALRPRSFRVWIIPHTLAVTALRERRTGDAVNLETDLLGKYVARFLTAAK
jgi:riboflavin synthase